MICSNYRYTFLFVKQKIFLVLILIIVFAIPGFSEDGKPVAVVLAGGGARGAYQIGVWKAMRDAGVNIGAVYGVSVGAINGAVMAAGDYDTAKELWLKIEKDNVMNIDDSTEELLTGEASLLNMVEAAFGLYERGGIDVSPLEQLLSRYLDETTIRSSGIEFGLAAFSVTEGRQKFYTLEDIPENQLVDYILASANFPLFQRKVIGGEEFIDGGIQQNMVIGMIDPAEYNRAVLVSLDMYTYSDLIDRVSGYTDYDIDVTFINPGIDLGSLLDFSPDNALELMRVGYLDGLKAFGKLSGIGYYFYGEESVRKMYLDLDEQERKTSADILEVDYKRSTDFSDGIHTFDSLIQPEFSRIDDAYAPLLELYAFGLGIPRDVLYSEAGLISEIVDKYIHRGNFSIYYNRYLDFLSYIDLRTDGVIYTSEEFDSRYLESYAEFKEN